MEIKIRKEEKGGAGERNSPPPPGWQQHCRFSLSSLFWLRQAAVSRPQSRFDHRRIFSLLTHSKKGEEIKYLKKKRPSSRESQFVCVVPCRPCASLSLCVIKTFSFLSKYLHPRVSCLCVCALKFEINNKNNSDVFQRDLKKEETEINSFEVMEKTD